MQILVRHLTTCFLAGIVAVLPVAGLAFVVVRLEAMIAASWLAHQPFYFPSLGLVCAFATLYLIGLTLTTWAGRWAWTRADRLLESVPLFGALFQTLKQILGYGQGAAALFKRVVLVPKGDGNGEELGLVTGEVAGPMGAPRLLVFVPGAPNPTNGRLVIVTASEVRTTGVAVNDALKTLVSVGVTPLVLGAEGRTGEGA